MIFEKLKALLSNQFDVDENSINLETRLVEDLGADSLDVVDLIEAVEDEFDVEIPDDIIETVHTVDDIVSYISDMTDFSNNEYND